MTHRYFLLGSLLIVSGLVYYFGFFSSNRVTGGASTNASPQVAIFTVDHRRVADRTEALGTARAWESVDISATVTEGIETLHFSDGEWVKEGQLLATLRQSAERAQLAEEQANLAEQLRELRRLEDLLKRKLASQTDIDQRRTQVERSQFRIDEIESRIGLRMIRAPFAGQLGLRRVSPGALAQPGMVIATLDDISRIKLEFRIPAALLASLSVGQPVQATTSSYDQSFTGSVIAIDSRINPIDRSVGVLAAFDNPDRLLKPGLLMLVELQRQPRQALVVPEESLVARQLQQFVWVVNSENFQVSQRPVAIGIRINGWVEVVEGLSAGEWIVQEGVSLVRDGMTVQVKNAAEPEQAPEQIGAN
ncbi:MAG: efflux RND transporter periplasmic adaptor subunit [Porticoccaceae bacterium]